MSERIESEEEAEALAPIIRELLEILSPVMAERFKTSSANGAFIREVTLIDAPDIDIVSLARWVRAREGKALHDGDAARKLSQ